VRPSTPRSSRPSPRWRLTGLAAAALLAGLVLAGCGRTDRPEGTVERWLTSLNQGSAGRPGQYAPELLSQGMLPNWRDCEPGAFDVIEVGRGLESSLPGQPHSYLVPYRVQYVDDRAERCHTTLRPDLSPRGVAMLLMTAESHSGRWSIAAARPASAGQPHLPLPSEGGPPVARPSTELWFIGIAVGLLLCGLVALLMRATPRPAPIPSEPLDPSEARGL